MAESKAPEKKGASMLSIMPVVTQPATIDELEVDVVMERETKFESEVTENPIETGFNIADHVLRKPMTLSLDVVFTPTPVTWKNKAATNESRPTQKERRMTRRNGKSGAQGAKSEAGLNVNRLDDVANALMKIYQAGEPVTITLVDAIYTDMIMTSAPLPRNVENGYCYRMRLEFTHIIRVGQKTEAIPDENTNGDAEGMGGETEKDAGSASKSDIGTGLQTVEHKTRVAVDTSSIDKGKAGKINTGKEETAKAVAQTVVTSLVARLWRR